jgi:hypothetical protein
MDASLIATAMEILAALNEIEETNGPVTENNIQVKMNDINEEVGIGIKGQILLAGPALEEIKADGSTLFPDHDDDLFVVISIKAKNLKR